MKTTNIISESAVENFLIEIDIINSRIKNLLSHYLQTNNQVLKKRLFAEHQDLSERLKEINSISKTICDYQIEETTISYLLLIQSLKSLNKIKENYFLFT